jgi:ubiquinone/menaquinone biosynthesis C-methylase UbiE
MKTLSVAEARRTYDRIGKTQDTQAFCEDRATAELIAHLDLPSATSVVEFSCGTRRFSHDLLAHHLPSAASYRGSSVMVRLASERLASFGARASVRLSEGGPPTDPSKSCDRFVSNFVLDLLSSEDIEVVIREAHRMLRPGDLLGLSSLTFGFTTASRIVSWTWLKIHAPRPSVVGGCRPLELLNVLPETAWREPSSPFRALCNPARSGGRREIAERCVLTRWRRGGATPGSDV